MVALDSNAITLENMIDFVPDGRPVASKGPVNIMLSDVYYPRAMGENEIAYSQRLYAVSARARMNNLEEEEKKLADSETQK